MAEPGRITVVFITHTKDLTSGAEISLVELIKGALKRGYKVIAVTPQEGQFSEEMKRLGVECFSVPFSWWSAVNGGADETNMLAVNRIKKVALQGRAAAIVSNTLTVPWGALAAALCDIPHVWIANEFPVGELAFVEDRYDFIDSFSNLLIANSKGLTKYLSDYVGRDIQYYYSYVDAENLSLNMANKKTQIINIGTIIPGKNQIELIEALALMPREYISTKKVLLIGGYDEKGPYFQKLKSLINRHNLNNIVEFPGNVQRPYSLVGPGDIIVQTSLSESMGRVIVEAMKLGLICVASDNIGHKESLSLGGGWAYGLGQPKELASILSDICEQHQSYISKAAKYKQRALKNMSEEKCTQPFFDGLSRAIGKPNLRRELRHLSGQFGSIEDSLVRQQRAINGYKKDIDNIINSKAWKIALMIRKLLGR